MDALLSKSRRGEPELAPCSSESDDDDAGFFGDVGFEGDFGATALFVEGFLADVSSSSESITFFI